MSKLDTDDLWDATCKYAEGYFCEMPCKKNSKMRKTSLCKINMFELCCTAGTSRTRSGLILACISWWRTDRFTTWTVLLDSCLTFLIFFVFFYSVPQCSHCKHCTSYSNSVCLSVCHTPVLCQTTARSTVQFALSDSKMCLSFLETKNVPRGMTPFPWNLGSNWPTPSKKQWALTRFAL